MNFGHSGLQKPTQKPRWVGNRQNIFLADFDTAQMPQRPPAVRANRWHALIVTVMLCLWQGLPFSIFGGNPLMAYQIYAVIAFLGLALYILRALAGRLRVQWWEFWSLALFLWCLLVSANYSMRIVPQPLSHWLPNMYSTAPIMVIFMMKAMNFTVEDVLSGLVWAGVGSSLIVIVDVSLHLPLLDAYARGSAFSDGRIVFMKGEVGLTLVALVGRLLGSSTTRMWKPLLLLIPTAFNLIVLTESRIFILASCGAIVLMIAFVAGNRQKVAAVIAAPFIGLPLVWYIVTAYFMKFTSLQDYLNNDISSQWRRLTVQHYSDYFYTRTGGMGFGFMSARPEYDNFISYSTNKAGALYGVPGYPVSLDDIGVFASFYQYGYPGLTLVLGMSLAMIVTLVRAHRINRDWTQVSAIGLLLLMLMINPIPQNYFTIFATAQLGGIMWFVASQVSLARRDAFGTLPAQQPET